MQNSIRPCKPDFRSRNNEFVPLLETLSLTKDLIEFVIQKMRNKNSTEKARATRVEFEQTCASLLLEYPIILVNFLFPDVTFISSGSTNPKLCICANTKWNN